MSGFRISKHAVADLKNIWFCTVNKRSEKQADDYYRTLINTCLLLANNPNTGKQYSEISEGLLGFRVGRHIIFYQQESDGQILIIRILHQMIDLKRRIKGE